MKSITGILCVFCWSTLLFFPFSFWRGVLLGRSEPNSEPLLLLFQGGRRCEPLKQQEKMTGGCSDSSHRQRPNNKLYCRQECKCSAMCSSGGQTLGSLKMKNIEIYSTHLTALDAVSYECNTTCILYSIILNIIRCVCLCDFAHFCLKQNQLVTSF